MTKTFRGIIEKDSKGYHAYVPALKGCHTWGRTVAQAKKHLQEALELYLEVLIEDGEPIPSDEDVEAIFNVEIPSNKKRSSHTKARKVVGVPQYAKVARN